MTQPQSSPPQQLTLNPPPEYELKLLTALAYFLGRSLSAQALACLSMYLRQSEPRIMSQVRYYAHKAGLHEYDLLDLIYEQPGRADELLQRAGKVHQPQDRDVFEESIEQSARD